MSESKPERLRAIDLARGISVILMVLVHTMLIYGNEATREDSVFGYMVYLMGHGAPMFLVSMGVSYVFSRRQGFGLTLKRGLFTMGIGYLMNTLKFIVPIQLFGGLPVPFVTAYGMTPGEPSNMLFFLQLGDILQLAGLSLILMGVVLRATRNKWVVMGLALALTFLSGPLSGYRPGVAGLDYMCDLLWGSQWNVYFPLFPWGAFILTGLFFGLWYQEQGRNRRLMFMRMLQVGMLMLLAGLGLWLYDASYHFGDFYHLGPGGTLALLGLNLVLFYVLDRLVDIPDPRSRVLGLIYYCSRHVTFLYVTQWTLINWGMSVFGFWEHDPLTVAGLYGMYLVLSLGVCWLWKEGIKGIMKVRKREKGEVAMARG
ncbi:heparan-alpha-glucosaminide N-acetyltransferase domain-containing protein [Roseivirga sp. BDSF3-8]|uniref:heparan-alpha-glucosaminide N-acetyltransferase domain-containing protein n=1 Tax=Roseivirga sp. BDSF3-8 TaxID=3241598 RepID=UPI003531FFDC